MPEKTDQEKKCVIFYKTGRLDSRNMMGDRFDGLESCCETFRRIFLQTGNKKTRDWNSQGLYDAEPEGINFVVYHGELALLLLGELVSFCFCCGAGVEIKKSRNVALKPKIKEVPDGYEESEATELEKCQ